MKIGRVIARLNVGGPAIQAILMTRTFRDRGYSSLLLTGHVAPGESSMEYLAEQLGIEPFRIPRMSRRISLFDDLAALGQIVRIFRREKPDLVHTHTAKAGALGRIAAILTGVPLRVHTFHGHVFDGYFSPVATRVFLAIERFLARHTDCIFAVSDSQRRELVETYRIAPAEKVITMPLGLDLDAFLNIAGRDGRFRTALNCAPEACLVAWAGRLTAVKNLELLVQTAAAVHSAMPGLRFVLAGDGELRDRTREQIAAAGLSGVAAFVGQCQEMPAVYADADLVLLTSRSEGTPVVLLEAMAAARTFVATDVGGIRDLMVGTAQRTEGFELFDNGILAPLDPGVLARAVQFLCDRPELREKMGLRGREFVAQRYTWQRLADDLELTYRKLREAKGVPTAAQSISAPSH